MGNYYIYGTGYYGKQCYKACMDIGITPKGFIVSDIKNSNLSIFNLKVFSYDSFIEFSDTADIIFIAIKGKDCFYIKSKFETLGFKNVFLFYPILGLDIQNFPHYFDRTTEEKKYLETLVKKGCKFNGVYIHGAGVYATECLILKKYLETLVKKSCKFNGVYIYGAGVYATECLILLKEMGTDVKAMLVSSKANNPPSVMGVPVFEFSEIESLSKDCYIVVAIKNNTALMQVVLNIIKAGFHNIDIYSDLKSIEQQKKNIKSLLWAQSTDYNLNCLAFGMSRKCYEKQKTTVFAKDIKFSILVPLYNTPIDIFMKMVGSVLLQSYKNWELVLVDASDDPVSFLDCMSKKLVEKYPAIKYKKLSENKGIAGNTNECLSMASGDYVLLLDHDDVLHPSVLFEAMKEICYKNADFIFTDEASFYYDVNDIFNISFKPDFAPDTLRSHNYICHCSIFKKELVEKTGFFNEEMDGSQDYDMILRLTEVAEHISHIPKILYYWRACSTSVAFNNTLKPYAFVAGRKAVKAQLNRLGLDGEVSSLPQCGSIYRIKYKIAGNPKVSIIIPNYERLDDLRKCISSIFNKTTYSNFEIIIVENNSVSKELFGYYKELAELHDNVKVVTWKGVFNYSAINNYALQFISGEYCLFLNNDTEVITPDWIQEMLMFAQRKDVGAVGACLFYPDDTIQHTGVIIGLGGVAGHRFVKVDRKVMPNTKELLCAQNLSAVTGACMLVRKDVWDQVGGFDENLKVDFNDVDLCLKIRKAGYLIVWTPFAELYHYESKSRGHNDTKEKLEGFVLHCEYFRKKWDSELRAGDPYWNPNYSLNEPWPMPMSPSEQDAEDIFL